MQKHVKTSIVDLVKNFPTNIYLQKSASIQSRKSLTKFGGDSINLFIRLSKFGGDFDGPSEIWKFGPSPKILFKFQHPEIYDASPRLLRTEIVVFVFTRRKEIDYADSI